jgi:RNA polymerase sigma factor for flagellar operon FliA
MKAPARDSSLVAPASVRAYRQHGYAAPCLGAGIDPARDQLVLEHLEMARRIALRVARRVPEWLSQDDLISAATIGLLEAAERYDESRGEPFIAFAEKRIRGAVLDELRRGDVMPRRVRASARKVGGVIRELEQELSRSPTDEEIATRLGVSLEVYHEDLEMLTHVAFVDLTEQVGQRDGEAPDAAGEVERKQLCAHLRVGLGRLPERDALVLSLYYVDELSYAHIGSLLGVSESRVCQLHARALSRLRVELDLGSEGKQR